MIEGRHAFTPFGFKSFCETEKRHCALYRKVRGEEKAVVEMTDSHRKELIKVNKTVNHEIRQVPEISFFSYKDDWKLPTTSGDCEDLALLKQARLIELGWPKNALLITVADMPGNVRHAVLTVSTNMGDVILDIVTDEIRHWREVDYRWIKRQSSRNMLRWVKINEEQT